MLKYLLYAGCLLFTSFQPQKRQYRIFDVHLHGSNDPEQQISDLKKSGVYKAAISSSWNLQEKYRKDASIKMLYGLMFPCAEGKVPYSLQPCFEDGASWPPLHWVEQQIKSGKIDFMGEMLGQYFGISASDSSLYPYYALAVQYNIPVGVHTGGAGPDHGSPHFKWELGNPALLKPMLQAFPTIRLWIMHGGDQYYEETIRIMKAHQQVYTDISVLCNPDIVPTERFTMILKAFLDAGLEDRILFGTDNGDPQKSIAAVELLPLLNQKQRHKIFFRNAERFFAKKN